MEAKWGRMHSNENYKTLHRGPHVVGWVVMINLKWVARLTDGTVRAEFDTMEEAQQFLTVIVSASEGENDG